MNAYTVEKSPVAFAAELEALANVMERKAATDMGHLTAKEAARFHKATEAIRKIADDMAGRLVNEPDGDDYADRAEWKARLA